MTAVWRRDGGSDGQDSESPRAPSSYWLPLFLVILACAGYILWRRRRDRLTRAYGSGNFSRGRAGVRLSMDDDGPAATSFIMNNGSNESLPSHALSDVPVLPQSPSPSSSAHRLPTSLPVHPARQSQNTSPLPSYTAPQQYASGAPSIGTGGTVVRGSRNDPLGAGAKVKKVMGGRRSARARGPVEGTQGESESESMEESEQEDVFGIGDDDDEPLAKLVK